MSRSSPPEAGPRMPQHVLVLAPFARDGPVVGRVLGEAGLEVRVCASAEELCRELGDGAGAVLLTEEALTGRVRRCLAEVLSRQPAWSDLPLLLLAARGSRGGTVRRRVGEIELTAHVHFLERPLGTAALVSAVRVAVESRRRQYQVRDQLAARQRAEAALRELNEELEATVERRTGMLRLLQDVTRSANQATTVEAAMEAALDRIARYDGWHAGQVWHVVEEEGGERPTFAPGIAYVGDQASEPEQRLRELAGSRDPERLGEDSPPVRVLRSGETAWIDDLEGSEDPRSRDLLSLGLVAAIAFPITLEGEVVAVLEFFSDHPLRRNGEFQEVLPDVGIQLGQVLRRHRLERDVAEATAELQRRIGSELHDSVGQELTGLGMVAEMLRTDLEEAGSPSQASAAALVDQLQRTHDHVRRLSRGLYPLEVDGEGLIPALDDLAETVHAVYRVPCTFRGDDTAAVEDREAVLHLYRIAQEAAQNAIRHGSPSQIRISLLADAEGLTLGVADDGTGFDGSSGPSRGAGLRIMRYRADLIGARLRVDAGPGRGTTVPCRLPRRGRPPGSG